MAPLEQRHFKAFIVLAGCGQICKAAEHLNTTQPQLSRMLKYIEEEVGCTLINRTTRSFSLTLAGEKFLEMAKQTLRMIDDTVRHTRMIGEGDFGELRVGYMDFVVDVSMPLFLRSLKIQKPKVDVKLEHSCTDQQRIALLGSNLDIGFLIAPFVHEDIETIPINSRRLMALLPDTHPLARRPAVKLNDLANEDFILGRTKFWRPYRELIDRLCLFSGYIPNVVHEPYNTDGILGLVAAGLGITIYPARDVRLNPRGVISKPISDINEEINIIAAWRKDNPSPVLAEFVEIIRKRVPRSTHGDVTSNHQLENA